MFVIKGPPWVMPGCKDYIYDLFDPLSIPISWFATSLDPGFIKNKQTENRLELIQI